MENQLAEKEEECREYEGKSRNAEEKVARFQQQLDQLEKANREMLEAEGLREKEKKEMEISAHNLSLKNISTEHSLELSAKSLEESQKAQSQLKAEIQGLVEKVNKYEADRKCSQQKAEEVRK